MLLNDDSGYVSVDIIALYPQLYGNQFMTHYTSRWDPSTQSWVKDDVTSLCIDAGDPMSPISHEPFPNGGIVNMGAYGGTSGASKSYFGEPLCEKIFAGDINGDCKVNFEDLSIMSQHWLGGSTLISTPVQPTPIQPSR